jgi:hypothetical protein
MATGGRFFPFPYIHWILRFQGLNIFYAGLALINLKVRIPPRLQDLSRVRGRGKAHPYP